MDGAGRSVVGSCADGSVIFATKWEDVHCEGAVRMPAGYVPRVASQRDRSAAVAEVTREDALEAQIAAHLVQGGAPRAHVAPVLLMPRDYADLRRFVSRGEMLAAASIEYERGLGSLDRMRLAHSRWFDDSLREAFAELSLALTGPVLVFRLEAAPGAPGAPVPSFAQGGVTFRPDPSDPRQLGWIVDEGAGSRPDTFRLGYVVLPVGFDVDRPVAIFWGDAVVATRPARGR
jgi:hypothetical protein